MRRVPLTLTSAVLVVLGSGAAALRMRRVPTP